MKKYFTGILALLFLTAATFPGKEKNKKTKTFEGKITYSLSYEDIPEEYQAYESMFPKEMLLYTKENKTRTEQPSGMGNTITITDSKKKITYIIMDMMGMKNAYKIDENDAKKKEEEIGKPEYVLTEETKEIAGYKCKKANVKMKGEEIYSVYYTEEIQTHSTQFKGLNGCPMEYTIKSGVFTVTCEAKSVSAEKVSDKFFEVPKGYEIKPYSEFPKMGTE